MTQLFEVEGINLNNIVDLISGDVDPSVYPGRAAKVGSLYFRSNGERWKKIDVDDIDWILDVSGSIDTSKFVTQTRSILVYDDSVVDFDVGVIACNPYYDSGIEITLLEANKYKHPITIKNLSILPIKIKPTLGLLEGKSEYTLIGKYSSITISEVNNNWVITSLIEGTEYIQKPKTVIPHTHTPCGFPEIPHC